MSRPGKAALGTAPGRDGCTLQLHVVPKSSTTALAGSHAGVLKVKVKAPPADGEANEALRRFLAGLCGVPPSSVTITRGASSRRKTVFVAGADEKRVRALLEGEAKENNPR